MIWLIKLKNMIKKKGYMVSKRIRLTKNNGNSQKR